MEPEIRWGILGAGRVARKFAADLQRIPGAKLVAIGSLSAERAEAFGTDFALAKRYGSYAALANDPSVDVIYVATRNHAHYPCVRLALEAGKAVLCEKPFTLDASQAKALVALARERRCFLMEGMWSRFFPTTAKLRELLAARSIGDVRLVQVDFHFPAEFTPAGRLFNPALGGGALLDVGIYTLAFAWLVLGAPEHVSSQAQIGGTGVDEQCGMVLKYRSGPLAMLSCGLRTNTAKEAFIHGTEGSLKVHAPWWKPHTLSLLREGQPPQVFREPYPGSGYQFEAIEVTECLRQRQLESPRMPLDETVAILETLDQVRAGWTV